MTLRIRLTDATTHRPLANRIVQAGPIRAATDATGMLIITGGHTGSITVPGYEPAPLTTATAGQLALRPDARTVAKRFVTAVQAGDSASVWAAFEPAAQAAWQTEAQCAAYYQQRFPKGSIRDFTVGAASPPHAVVDPDTDTRLAHAVTVSLSVVFAPAGRGPAAAMVDLPAMTLVNDGGRWRVASAGAVGIDAAIVPPNPLPNRRLRVPIMMYHHIAPTPIRANYRTDYDYRLAYSLTVTPQAFAAQLDYLKRAGYHTVTPHAILNALFFGVPLPPKPIALTFDDGYLDNATYAVPLLQRYNMTGTFNVITAMVGQRGTDLQYMSWNDLKTMVAEGMTIESHTVTHRDLGILTRQEDAQELVQSRKTIQSQLHVAVDVLTYPSGEPFRSESVTRQQQLLSLLPASGYAGGLLDPLVAGTLQAAQHPYELTRVRVSGGEALAGYLSTIGGIRLGPGVGTPLPSGTQ